MNGQRRRRRLLARRAFGALILLTLVPVGMEAPSAAGASVVTSAQQPADTRLEAASATLRDFVLEPAPASPGEPKSLKLTSASADLLGLRLVVPCEQAAGSPAPVTTEATTPADASSSAPDGITVYATSVTATTDVERTWTPDNLLEPLVLPEADLTGVTIELAPLTGPSVVAPSLSLQGLHLTTSFCTP